MLSRRAKVISTNVSGSFKDTFDDTLQGNEKLFLPCLDFTSQQESYFTAGSFGTVLSTAQMPR